MGRVLGIGVRVAGRIAGQRIAVQSHAAGAVQTAGVTAAQVRSHPVGGAGGRITPQTKGGVGQGIGGLLRPFRRVGGILWLEITGVFFLLPVVVFAPVLWRQGMAYSHTSDHRAFWVTAGVVVVFLYLGVSSFWRARKR